MSRVYYDQIAVDLVRAEAMAYGDFGGLLADLDRRAKSKAGRDSNRQEPTRWTKENLSG